MYRKLAAAAVIGALISTAAIAQTSNTGSSSTKSAQTTNDKTEPASAKGQWQASKLIHMNVYNAQNEKIGDIKELMLDKSGKVEDVVIGVGGFLGMGEHDVAVKFDRLKWSDSAATTGSGQAASQTKNADRNYPDHAVLNATRTS